ncbi:MAG: hypothetical protein KIT58_10725, partial [Planctomycetota bacterium]|nr:hypothetical protein [Planctomycetota bacterium]
MMSSRCFVLALAAGAALAAPALGQTAPVAQSPDGRARQLLQGLADGKGDPDAVAYELARLGPPAQPAIIDLLGELERAPDIRATLWALAEHPTPAVRALLLRLVSDRRPVVRQCVADHLRLFPEDAGARDALLRLAEDPDEHTVELALGAFLRAEFDCWAPLLDAVGRELAMPEPRESRVYPMLGALAAALARDRAPRERLDELLRAVGYLEEAAARERLFTVVTRGRPAALLPYLVRVIDEALPPPPRRPAVDDEVVEDDAAAEAEYALARAFEVDGPFEPLRPFSPAVVSEIVEQLALTAYTSAFEAVRRAAGARDAEVRRAALRGIWRCAGTDEQRDEAIRVLAGALGVADRSLRAEAHKLLVKVTRQRLPLSQSAWLDWVEKRAGARRAARELAARG